MRAAFWLLFLASLCQTATARSDALVGDLGDPERLAIQSAATFSPEQIRSALLAIPQFQLDGDANAPLDKYLATVERLIAAGYRHGGFANVIVKAAADQKAHAINVQVVEGSRYLAGEIQVRGNKTIPVAQLIARLTEPYPPNNATVQSPVERGGKVQVRCVDSNGKYVDLCNPVWQSGQPAHLLTVPEAQSKLHEDVAAALADLGYRWTKFTVDVVPNPVTKKADLAIDVSDEGGRSVLARADVTGNEANSREDILKYVDFKPGTPATREEQVRIQTKLWESGRFIRSDVAVYHATTPADKTSLQITVLELHGLPPLTKPLSPEDKVFLKCRDWFANYDRWDGDFVCRIDAGNEGSVCVVASPRDGAFVHLKFEDVSARTRGDLAAVASRSDTGFYNLLAGRKITMPSLNRKMIASVALQLDDNANDKTAQFHKLMFGIGVNSERVESTSPLDLTLSVPPVVFLEMAHDSEAKYAIRDGVLTMITPKKTLRLDAASGRLLDYTESMDQGTPDDRREGKDHTDENTQEQGKDKMVSTQPVSAAGSGATLPTPARKTLHLSIVPGEFRRRLDAIHAATAKVPNAYDAVHPVSSLLAFACDEDLLWWQYSGANEHRPLRRVVRRMADNKVFEPLDKMIIGLCADNGSKSGATSDDFSVPDVTRASDGANTDIAAIGACFSWLMHGLFRPGSWPEVLSRDALMMVTGNGEAANVELSRVYRSEKNGPLCFLTASQVLIYLNPPAAQMMASRGLERLSLQDFRKEYAVFLNPKYPMGQFALRGAQFLREADQRDVDAIGSLLPADAATKFQQTVQLLRRDSKPPADLGLPAILDSLWRDGLRDRVKAALESLEIAARPYIQQSQNRLPPVFDHAG
jgi:hypothetical protein